MSVTLSLNPPVIHGDSLTAAKYFLTGKAALFSWPASSILRVRSIPDVCTLPEGFGKALRALLFRMAIEEHTGALRVQLAAGSMNHVLRDNGMELRVLLWIRNLCRNHPVHVVSIARLVISKHNENDVGMLKANKQP